jgi:molybdopterin-guanine dinucleotide biosynthesis protein
MSSASVISIIGLLDSGKSSLIEALLEEARARGATAGVVINDAGAVQLDRPDIARDHPVRTIGGG